ncbi:MAG: acetolactate synthase small subunit [Muribaculaceae bacterium]|nr:acetolactate synthase small subunit [Muribaculaceae bacterium]
MEPEQQLFTLAIFTENHVGLLNQLSIIFTRRCLNIESVSASASAVEGVHKIILTCITDRRSIEKAIQQIEKRIDVIKAFVYVDDEVVYQEIALYKISTPKLFASGNFESLMRRHNARILDITPEYAVIEKTGHFDETEKLFHELKDYDLSQFVRSGRVSITKGSTELVDIYLREQEERRKILMHED